MDTYTIEDTTPGAYSEIIELLADEEESGSRAGGMRELIDVEIVSRDPRERWLLRDDGFNVAFALQESFAYWNGLNPGHVQRYNTAMENWMVDGELPGSAYGDRLRNTAGHDQIERVVEQLRESPDTRRAIAHVHQPAVEDYEGGDVSCTDSLHFLLRDGELHLLAEIRSQDMLWGFPYDAQNNQYIQEAVAGLVGAELGEYRHRMNSCHYYTEREDQVLRAAEVHDVRSTPDMRLGREELDDVMLLLRRGLEETRDGSIPALYLTELEDIHPAYADWLRFMLGYERDRFHDDPGCAATLADGMAEVQWWGDVLARRAAE